MRLEFSERVEQKIAEAYEKRELGATAIGLSWGISVDRVRSIARRVRRKRERAIGNGSKL